jgi:hypothetical protein
MGWGQGGWFKKPAALRDSKPSCDGDEPLWCSILGWPWKDFGASWESKAKHLGGLLHVRTRIMFKQLTRMIGHNIS